MNDVAIVGPVGIRGPMTLDKACEAHQGHEHNYDHTTIIISGRVKVLYRYAQTDGTEVEGETVEFGQGETIEIRAKVRHTIIALEDNTRYLCVFSHRDFGGIVVEKYEASLGNHHAYV